VRRRALGRGERRRGVNEVSASESTVTAGNREPCEPRHNAVRGMSERREARSNRLGRAWRYPVATIAGRVVSLGH